MMKVEKLKAEDFKMVMARGGKSYIGATLTEEQARALEETPESFSIFADGKLIACAGVAEYWAGRGESWAVIATDCKADFFRLHNVVKRYLEICPIRRVEASVDCDFPAGHRWVKALGFTLEAERLKSFLPDGKDAAMYARVK